MTSPEKLKDIPVALIQTIGVSLLMLGEVLLGTTIPESARWMEEHHE